MEIQTLFSSGSSLTWQDYSVLLVILALVIFVGFYSGREEKSTNDFFLGGEKSPGGRLVWRLSRRKSAPSP